MSFNLIIFAKNYNSITIFFKTLEKICSNKKIKIKIFYKNRVTDKKIKKLTLLKSPHVNKTAQENFKSYVFSKSIKIYSTHSFKLLVLIKKLNSLLLFDVKLQIKVEVNKLNFKNNLINAYNPNQFKLNKKKSVLKKYINLFNKFGEIKLNNTIKK